MWERMMQRKVYAKSWRRMKLEKRWKDECIVRVGGLEKSRKDEDRRQRTEFKEWRKLKKTTQRKRKP